MGSFLLQSQATSSGVSVKAGGIKGGEAHMLSGQRVLQLRSKSQRDCRTARRSSAIVKEVLFAVENDCIMASRGQNRLSERKPAYQMARLTPGPDQTTHGCNA